MTSVNPTVTIFVGAIAAAISISEARAADLASPRDMPQVAVEQSVPAAHRLFYLRGDLGVGFNDHGDFSQANLAANGGSFISEHIGITVSLGAGIGVQINPRFRVDLTGEYRFGSRITATDDVSGELAVPAGTLHANTQYDGRLSAAVGLLNAYWDIGHWGRFTPYVGAGIGFAHLKVSDVTTSSLAVFTDAATGQHVNQSTSGYADSHSRTNLAWALMAGTSLDLSDRAKLDIGYRYLNLGSGETAESGLLVCNCGTVGESLKMADIQSHEVRIGIRWLLNNEMPSYQPLK